MSEVNNNEVTPEELVQEVHYRPQLAEVIPTALDPTLTVPGVAADAYATGQAIAQVLDGLLINNKALVAKALTLYGTDILMSSESGAVTIPTAIQNLENRDASEIMFNAQELITVKDVIDGIKEDMDKDLTEEEIAEIFAEVFGGEE